MKKAIFIVATLFLLISAAGCIFSNVLVIDAIRISGEGSPDGLALIITIPLAIFGYIGQFCSGMISLGFAIKSKSSTSPHIRNASIAYIVIVLLMIVVSAVFFALLAIPSADTETARVLLSARSL